jgi:hypothetical protein
MHVSASRRGKCTTLMQFRYTNTTEQAGVEVRGSTSCPTTCGFRQSRHVKSGRIWLQNNPWAHSSKTLSIRSQTISEI